MNKFYLHFGFCLLIFSSEKGYTQSGNNSKLDDLDVNPIIFHKGIEYSNIQKTINDSKEGDTIRLSKGIYTEPITIKNKRNLTIEVESLPVYILIPDFNYSVITIDSSDNISIKGLYLKHDVPPKQCVEAYGFEVKNSSNIDIRKCYINGSGTTGLKVENVINSVFHNNIIEECSGYAIVMVIIKNFEVSNNLLQKNNRGIMATNHDWNKGGFWYFEDDTSTFHLKLLNNRITNSMVNSYIDLKYWKTKDNVILRTPFGSSLSPTVYIRTGAKIEDVFVCFEDDYAKYGKRYADEGIDVLVKSNEELSKINPPNTDWIWLPDSTLIHSSIKSFLPKIYYPITDTLLNGNIIRICPENAIDCYYYPAIKLTNIFIPVCSSIPIINIPDAGLNYNTALLTPEQAYNINAFIEYFLPDSLIESHYFKVLESRNDWLKVEMAFGFDKYPIPFWIRKNDIKMKEFYNAQQKIK